MNLPTKISLDAHQSIENEKSEKFQIQNREFASNENFVSDFEFLIIPTADKKKLELRKLSSRLHLPFPYIGRYGPLRIKTDENGLAFCEDVNVVTYG